MANERFLKLHGVVVESLKGGYTGYFSEFPEAIAEGETEAEMQSNLLEALREVLSYKREESGNAPVQDGSSSFELNLEIA